MLAGFTKASPFIIVSSNRATRKAGEPSMGRNRSRGAATDRHTGTDTGKQYEPIRTGLAVSKKLLDQLDAQRTAWAVQDWAKAGDYPAPVHWFTHANDHHDLGRELAYKAPNDEAQKVFEAFAARLALVDWADLKKREISILANESANEVKRANATLEATTSKASAHAFAANLVTARGVEAPRLPKNPNENDYTGAIKRTECVLWWRRAYRVLVQRTSEAAKVRAFEVSKAAGQAYSSNTAVIRRMEQNKANADMLANSYLTNDEGHAAPISDFVEKSTSNKAIRRGELMTRIRGCEDIADQRGDVGVFYTMTAPSRFHPVTINGKANPSYLGATPKEAQAWLTAMWGKVRAKLKRHGVDMYGVRVAEPHHDSCPHWHLLAWSVPEHVNLIDAVIRQHWLSDAGHEAGAQKYRIKSEGMLTRGADGKGGAAAYLAKYVAKNIDDYKVEGHRDEINGETIELFGDADAFKVATAMRVEAWASHWGIRQFQTFGMPPVGVWRELRRLDEKEVTKANNKTLQQAFTAVHRIGEGEGAKRADWAAYTIAQGGIGEAGSHRNCKIKVMRRNMEREGRYQVLLDKSPIGIKCGAARVLSNRKDWRSITHAEFKEIRRESKGAKRPRTRFNNCTQPKSQIWAGLTNTNAPHDSNEGAIMWRPWQQLAPRAQIQKFRDGGGYPREKNGNENRKSEIQTQ